MDKEKPRLLIIETHHAGDAVMMLPLVRGAAERFKVTVLCRPETADFFKSVEPRPEVVRLHPDWNRNVFGLGHGAPAEALHHDVAISVWPDPRVYWFMVQCGAKRRIGFEIAARNWYGVNRPWRKHRLQAARILQKIYSITAGKELLWLCT